MTFLHDPEIKNHRTFELYFSGSLISGAGKVFLSSYSFLIHYTKSVFLFTDILYSQRNSTQKVSLKS